MAHRAIFSPLHIKSTFIPQVFHLEIANILFSGHLRLLVTSRNASVDLVSDFSVRTVGELKLLDRLLHHLVLLALFI